MSFQTRNTEQNFLLLNLIVSEVSLSLLAMPIDLYNSITRGGLLDSFVCPLVGFIHTFFGKLLRFDKHTYYMCRNTSQIIIHIYLLITSSVSLYVLLYISSISFNIPLI